MTEVAEYPPYAHGGRVPLVTRIKAETRQALDDLAKAEGVTRSEMFRRAVTQYVNGTRVVSVTDHVCTSHALDAADRAELLWWQKFSEKAKVMPEQTPLKVGTDLAGWNFLISEYQDDDAHLGRNL